jgi:hypothetical protein
MAERKYYLQHRNKFLNIHSQFVCGFFGHPDAQSFASEGAALDAAVLLGLDLDTIRVIASTMRGAR